MFTPKAEKERKRRVLLVNGNAAGLFDRYVADAKEKKISVDLEHLTVILFEEGGKRELRGGDDVVMSIGNLFSGMTMQQLWKRHLKEFSASNLPDPVGEAVRLDADVRCGG